MTNSPQTRSNPAEVARLGEVLGVFSRRYYEWLTRQMEPLEVNPGRRRVLRLLIENGPMKMSQLASELQLDPKRMTKLIDLLEESNLVERRSEAGDRRAKLVQLTDHGRAQWLPINEGFADIVESLVDDLSREERAELLRLVTTITSRLYLTTED